MLVGWVGRLHIQCYNRIPFWLKLSWLEPWDFRWVYLRI